MRRFMPGVERNSVRVAGCVVLVGLLSTACGEDAAPPAASASEPVTPEPAPTREPSEAETGEPNPCDRPAAVQLELSAGVTEETPWGLTLTYAVGEKNRAGQPTYEFTLRHGERRWRTTRSWGNWNSLDTWRGFCWRGAERPEERAPRVRVDVAPVCENGKLMEMGGCRQALK